MESAEIRQKLHLYIENAEEKKLQAIFTMVEDEINEYYDHWKNEEFINELYQREQAYINGSSTTYNAAESALRAREAIKRSSQ